MRSSLIAAALIACLSVAARPTFADGEHAHVHHRGQATDGQGDHANPYAGYRKRAIKALSPKETAGLQRGEGLGMALAAELNGYPGPRHILEFASELKLTDEERKAVETAFREMNAEARRLGARVIAAEAELDRMFASGRASKAELVMLTSAIGEMRGALRATHLRYHLTMRATLSQEQLRAYQELRGYAAGE